MFGHQNPLNAEVPSEKSCIFFGNISYVATPEELIQTFKIAGPFKEFRLKQDTIKQEPKGFGFCLYEDADIASSALRNLKKYELRGRPMKADFASDNKNGNNLKKEDVLYRDRGEIVKQST